MSFTFKSLFVETITSPREAAQKIIDIGVSRQTSILSIVFTICITVILFFLDLSSSENSIVLPLLMHHPLMLASVMILGTLWSAIVIGFIGKILGGYDDLDGILVLLAWGQAVQVSFQVIATLIALLSIQLAALFQLGVFLGVFFIYIWIFISFIDVALKLENLFKAFFVTFSGLIVAFISVSMVLSLFVGLFNV